MSLVAAVATTLLRRDDPMKYDPELCTFETCDIEWSFYRYRPSLAANATLTALFAISLIAYAIQGVMSKRFYGFSIAMVLGTICECLGYVGRIMMWNNPWKEVPFMIQICCLTIGPAFLAAGIYFCLSRIVTTFGRENSRLGPLWYPRIFIPCDVLSLALQGAGGGIASTAVAGTSAADLGKNIMIAGLVSQVVTLGAFIILAIDFSLRTLRRMKSMGEGALDPRHAALRRSFAFRGFLVALSVATLLIFTRCVYRIAELSGGWDGHLMKDEPLFIALEGGLIVAAVFALNLFNPGLCFREGYDKTLSEEMK
ncbi:hypothetical protein AJ80_08037 [Polytolypa hystricis UAMH7299]|uniref:Parasitic phase-specific protein PSP-1 n=1 Tax=Polytolypa hystricis (strain UAMH7299) TaxID=1447883 RepID=A0A2B7XER5_POLH7|nr:hypothetical protein AJ80_08037 [Polytolypa hystricis UAMH7299]